MTAQKGKDLLIKIGRWRGICDHRGPARPAAWLSTRRPSTSPMPNPPGAGGKLLGGAGVQRASLSGGGLFKDQASDALTRAVFFAGEIRAWQVAIPGFGTVTGPFQDHRTGICRAS